MATNLRAGLAAALVTLAVAGVARADGAFPNSQNIMAPAALPHELLLGTNFGLVISVDDGRSWVWSCEQPLNGFATLYQVGPPPANRLFAVSPAGVITSDDVGCSWSAATGLAPGAAALDVFADPTDASRVLAVTTVPADAGAAYEVRASANGGRSFDTPIYTAAAGDHVTGVEVARSAPQTLYLTVTSGLAFTPKVAQSTDGGAHWALHDLSASLPAGAYSLGLVAVDPTDAKKLFLRVGGPGGEALAVSTNGGVTATTPIVLTGGALTAFTRLPSGTLIAAGAQGTTNVAYRSTDAGATFTKLPTALPVRGLAARGTTVYAATDTSVTASAIETSSDEGMTWAPLMAYRDIQAIQSCLREACNDDCLARADMDQWSDAICSATAPPDPADGGAAATGGRAVDAGAPATGGRGAGGTGGAGASSSSGSCGCRTGSGRASWVGAVLLGAALLGRRRRRRAD